MNTPTPAEIRKLKDIKIRGKQGEYLSREDIQFCEMMYFGKYKEWYDENGKAMEKEVWKITNLNPYDHI